MISVRCMPCPSCNAGTGYEIADPPQRDQNLVLFRCRSCRHAWVRPHPKRQVASSSRQQSRDASIEPETTRH
jgi:hypothetical protein